MALDPEAFGDALSAWMEALTPSWPPTDTLPATALDGQALRGTGTIDERPQLLIAAYEHPAGAVLKPLAVPPETHEQKAALGLLKPWVLTGRVITAGARHCQPETRRLITASGGHYVIPVKDNPPTLRYLARPRMKRSASRT